MKKIVFLGNPNVGKSALINAMSNSKIKVGNWPGVTVEKLEANFEYKKQKLQFVDLPGTYNFTNDHEEKITTDVLLSGDYDLIANVVDATNLERNLNVTLLARELGKPMILLLNFDDDVIKSGLSIDTNKLEKYLQMPVFRTSATKKTGLNHVLDYIAETDFKSSVDYNIYYDSDIDNVVSKIHDILLEDDIKEPSYGYKFLTYRLFEREPHYTVEVPESTLIKVNQVIINSNVSLQESSSSQLHLKRYEQIENVLKNIVDKKGASRYRLTKSIDKIVLNRFIGLPLFFIFAVYFLSLIFNVANPLNDWVDGFINVFLYTHIQNLIVGLPDWFQTMILDGILAGVGGVLVFTPLMYFIYILMGILEESGIMSRIAFLMDRLMRSLGLNGKAFISMIIGFGCTVPAITSTRVLEDEKSRKVSTMMLPFVSCGARLPVYALFTAAFFSRNAGLIVASLYILGLVIAILIALILKAFKIYDNKGSKNEAFTIELPPYRIPEARILFKNVNNRLKGFLRRVTTLIMIILFAIWALNYFPNGKQEDSYLTKATEIIQPIFAPTGFGESKEAVSAIPTAIAAKEAVVGTIQAVVDTEDSEEEEVDASIQTQITGLYEAIKESIIAIPTSLLKVGDLFNADPSDLSDSTISNVEKIFTGEDAKLKAYSYMTFILLLTPCAVALATIRKEFDTKFMVQVLIVTLMVPYTVSTLVYQIGRLIM